VRTLESTPTDANALVGPCLHSPASTPIRWEMPFDDDLSLKYDERLWFEAHCGSRDFLVGRNGHTSRGRMLAWCPHRAEYNQYSVSLGEMGAMSDECRYYVQGFLAGNEPPPPRDDEGETEPHDLAAWWAATRRFRRTGSWFGRWATCSTCGCVLLPGTAGDQCSSMAARSCRLCSGPGLSHDLGVIAPLPRHRMVGGTRPDSFGAVNESY
jgi:hypothetical protein